MCDLEVVTMWEVAVQEMLPLQGSKLSCVISQTLTADPTAFDLSGLVSGHLAAPLSTNGVRKEKMS